MEITEIELPAAVREVLCRLWAAGYEAYAVGGCVRDSLRGVAPKDYDVTTSALPEQTQRVFAGYRTIETGLRHGTLTVLCLGQAIEVTTYRIDGGYTDGRHPDSVTFTASLQADAARRDFTINAMAYAPDRKIMDFYGGRADLAAHLIRAVGNPSARFDEDALRILRALRFASVLGFTIEEKTAAALRAGAGRLDAVSPERIREELIKLLCGRAAESVLRDYADVVFTVLPELAPMRGFEQHSPYHCYDVWEHTLHAVGAIPPEPILRLAALLHDAGKPATFSLREGVGHFFGHAAASETLADALLRRLRFDRATREEICRLVRHHDGVIEPEEKTIRRKLSRLGEQTFFRLLALQRADCEAQHPALRDRLKRLELCGEMARRILDEQPCLGLSALAVNGDTLIRAGIAAPGRSLGATLSALLDEVLEGKLENSAEPLLRRAAALYPILQQESDNK